VSNSYQAIARENIVVDKVPGITMDTTERARIVGEARFSAGAQLLQLVRMYGDVPVVLHAATSASQGLIPRTPADSVYKLIHQRPDGGVHGAAGQLLRRRHRPRRRRARRSRCLAKVYLTQKNWTLARIQTAGKVIQYCHVLAESLLVRQLPDR